MRDYITDRRTDRQNTFQQQKLTTLNNQQLSNVN